MTLSQFFSITPFSWDAIGTAVACGSIVGIERQLRGKPVGIRTSALITLGTYLFIAAAATLNSSNTDPSRVIGQVITGIGFLGAGVMLTRDGIVLGVTSAATIWALASIGVVIAMDHLFTAVKLSLIVVAVLVGVDLLEDYSEAFTKGVHRKISKWRRRNGRTTTIDGP